MRTICRLLTVLLLGTGLSVTIAPADMCATILPTAGPLPAEPPLSWKIYTNARFGFSIRYPSDWRLGSPLPDGAGVTITPPIPHSRFALTGFLNLVEGAGQDKRQTLDEFAAAHHRIIGEYYEKKRVPLQWQKDQTLTLGGFPAKQVSFSYRDETKTDMIEQHIFSLGRNEGRGVRIKFPSSSRATLMPILAEVLKTYQAGRDQNAVSPFAPKDGERAAENAP